MQRRDALKFFGAGAAGVALGDGLSSPANAEEHGQSGSASKGSGSKGSGGKGAGGKEEGGHGEHHHARDQPLQPIDNIHLHFCGFHIAKSNPKIQFETQHFCCAHGYQMHQCVLYDKTTADAKLLGVEYIITDEAYQALPEEEKKYWHAHTYEVLGGGLIAPGMSQAEEDAFMKALLPTWGKAYHTWPDPTTKVPMGEPMLMWSLMGDGQANPAMEQARDKSFGVSTEKIAKRRQAMLGLPKPDVAMPADMNTLARQWTNTGPDTANERRRQLGG